MSEGRASTRRRRAGERTKVPVSGGVLVYEHRAVGREMVGFEDVESWADLRTALAARGIGVGAVNHLPELDGGDDGE